MFCGDQVLLYQTNSYCNWHGPCAVLYCVTVIQSSVWWSVIYTIKALGWERGITWYSGIFDPKVTLITLSLFQLCLFLWLFEKALCCLLFILPWLILFSSCHYFKLHSCWDPMMEKQQGVLAHGLCVRMYRWVGPYYSKPWWQTLAKHVTVLGKGK